MWEDPIVAEVHRAREKLAAQFNFDIGAYFADIRRRQAVLGGRLVPQKKQAESTADADRGRPSGSPDKHLPLDSPVEASEVHRHDAFPNGYAPQDKGQYDDLAR